MVVATTFASNVARLKTLAEAGRAAGRAGRGARPGDEHHAEDRARRRGARRLSRRRSTRSTPTACRARNLLVLATGSQGERRAATAQLAQGKYMGLELQARRHLPLLVQDHPRQRGRGRAHPEPAQREGRHASIDESDGLYHVSGHANRPDLVRDAGAAAPADAGADARRAPPPLGPRRARRASAASPRRSRRTARMLDLTGDAPRIVEQVETGRVYLDGTRADRRDGRGGARPHPHGAARPRRGQRHHRRGRPPARRRLGRGDRPARQPEDARRPRGRARGRDRPDARRGPSAPSSTTTTRSTS